jgi:hypothetical protein
MMRQKFLMPFGPMLRTYLKFKADHPNPNHTAK